MHIVLIGNITKDIELKYFESGTCKTSFSVAINSYDFVSKTQKPSYFNVDAWNKTAEFISEHYKKGNTISLLAEFKEAFYEKNGERKSRKYFNVLKVFYTNAFTTLSGKVEKLENRYTTNNKRTQYIKLDDSDITIINETSIEIASDDECEILGELRQREKDYILNASVVNIIPKEIIEDKEEEIVKFDDVSDEEIPF